LPNEENNLLTKLTSSAQAASNDASTLEIRFHDNNGIEHVKTFASPIVIGRDISCDLQLHDDCISRLHVKLFLDQGIWLIRDLGSTNGTYFNDRQISTHQLISNGLLRVGNQGPTLKLYVKSKKQNDASVINATTSPTEAGRYFDPNYAGPIGDHTQFIRKAFQDASKAQSKSYLHIITIFSVLLISALVYTIYQQYQLEQFDSLTVSIFYDMKEVELQIAALENTHKLNSAPGDNSNLNVLRDKLTQMEDNYDRYLAQSGFIKSNMSEQDRLIFRMARIFGECEVNLPDGFINEVKAYIEKWRSSNRLEEAVKRAEINGYSQIVRKVMAENYLPPQFFYLALQESDFKRNSVGPKTRYGIAKGIWQFIPVTATRYGLRTGPLLEQKIYDPKDERFDFDKATRAAARYIREIYATDAQASGLLVLASYNWGEHRIIERIRKMPKNPRERNFWKLLKKHNIPRETYDYVYYIFSAAVIGENPKLFGFDFKNPLIEKEANNRDNEPYDKLHARYITNGRAENG
jgi:membrane-bound lytic murein transglycosylase D